MINNKGSVEWRITWLIIVVITFVIAITVLALMFYVSSHGQSPFSYFGNILGGGGA